MQEIMRTESQNPSNLIWSQLIHKNLSFSLWEYHSHIYLYIFIYLFIPIFIYLYIFIPIFMGIFIPISEAPAENFPGGGKYVCIHLYTNTVLDGSVILSVCYSVRLL